MSGYWRCKVYNEKGEKITVTGRELKELAKAGMITPGTLVETEDGKKAPAKKVKGLKFAEATPSEQKPEVTTPEPDPFTSAPPKEANPFTGTMSGEPRPTAPAPPVNQTLPNYFYFDTNGQKQGAFILSQLKELVAQGIITPDTPMETDTGHKCKARQIKGLFRGAITHDIPPAEMIEILNYNFNSARIFMIAVIIVVIIAEVLLPILRLLLPIFLPFWVVYTLMLHHRLWKLIPKDIARTTPGKAVGFLFIPCFNIYWIFISYIGLCKDMNTTLRQRGNSHQVGKGWAKALCVLVIFLFLSPVIVFLLIGMIPNLPLFLGGVWFVSYLVALFATLVVIPSFYMSVKNGAIALLEQEKCPTLNTTLSPTNHSLKL